jgi:hypothetical protein
MPIVSKVVADGAKRRRDRTGPADVPRLRRRRRDLRHAGGERAELGLEADFREPALFGCDVERQRPVERGLIADLDLGQRLRLRGTPVAARPSVTADAIATIVLFMMRLLLRGGVARASLSAGCCSLRSIRQMRVRKCTNDSWSITSSVRSKRSQFSALRTVATSMISRMRPGPPRHHDDASARYTASSTACVMNSTGARVDARQFDQLLLHHDARLCVERAERLVHQQHVGVEDVASRDGDALLHAAGELMRVRRLVALQAHQLDLARDALAARRRPARLWRASRNRCCRRRTSTGTARTAETRRARSGPGWVTGTRADAHRSRRRELEPGGHSQARRLPAARRPDDRDELAVAHIERDVVERGKTRPSRSNTRLTRSNRMSLTGVWCASRASEREMRSSRCARGAQSRVHPAEKPPSTKMVWPVT